MAGFVLVGGRSSRMGRDKALLLWRFCSPVEHVAIPVKLCASYRSSCLPAVQKALDDGHLKLLDLLEKLEAVSLDIGETIWNINTPEEWSAWQGAADR